VNSNVRTAQGGRGRTTHKVQARRTARKSFEDLDKRRDMYIVLHDSCESFYDIKPELLWGRSMTNTGVT
jgi:hypothetical protein